MACVVLFLAACAGAATDVARLDAEITAEHDAEVALHGVGDEARRAVLDLRAAQLAYVAAGQDRDYWLARVTATLELVSGRLAELARGTSAAGARAELDSAATTMTHFGEMDARARDLIGDDQTLPASDLIFTDGLELTDTAYGQIDGALATERAARAAAQRGRRARQAVVLVATAAAGLLLLLLLVPGGAQPAPASDDAQESLSILLGSAAVTDFPLDAIAPPADDADAAGDLRIEAAEAEPDGQTGAAASTPIIDRLSELPDLSAMATLCTDLGRVADSEQLPTLLQRAAGLIGASGLIVWLRDGSSQSLRAVIAHGYPPKALARMGDLPCDGDNAAATAFRTARVQVVERQGDGNSAVVAPLLAATGCVGVLTAELTDDVSAQTRALASIIAAQLVVLLGGNVTDQAPADDAEPVSAKTETA